MIKYTRFTKKQSIADQPLLEKKSTSTQSKEFFIQIGAFFLKGNATKLVKKLKSTGSNAEIHIRNVKYNSTSSDDRKPHPKRSRRFKL
uniref:SPOR domain-containing protein n=1 Tax=uncultured bacterium 4050020-J15 TaxID=1343840 RepID=S4W9U5_9BACT|nr:hypothetical protein [uncultured bacterium 4050020-J15]